MEDFVFLLFLLLTLTIETRSLPYAADANHNCSAPNKYVKEGTGLCCSRCPPGHKRKTECTETHDTVCEPCDAGQYLENWNYAQNCITCPKCKEDRGLQDVVQCSSTTRAKCGCKPGRYCYMGNSHGCLECASYRTCKQGFGVAVQGTLTSDVRCQKCPEGTFSDTVSFTDICKPHKTCDERNIISKGNATSDTVCNPVASTQTNAELNTKPETAISTSASQLWQTTTVKSKSLPITSANSTITGILLNTKTAPNLTKSQVPDTGPDKQLAAVVGGVSGIFLLIIVIVLLVLCTQVSKKPAFKNHTKVDANGNCETDSDETNHCYHGDTHHLSVITAQPEQQCLLQNGIDKHNSIESIEPLQSTIPLHQPESALSEPLPLQSNMYSSVSQNGLTAQTSSQPTSPQNMTPSPLVNVNINLHIGNGTCSSPAVMLKDMPPAEPQIPFGEEEESCSLQRQEDGKPSLLSVEESGGFNNTLLKTLEQFV